MKADIHPKYNEVVFQDVTSDLIFLTRSTLTSKEKIKWEDGKEYPVFQVEISSASHPFYTGTAKTIDTASRVMVRAGSPRDDEPRNALREWSEMQGGAVLDVVGGRHDAAEGRSVPGQIEVAVAWTVLFHPEFRLEHEAYAVEVKDELATLVVLLQIMFHYF